MQTYSSNLELAGTGGWNGAAGDGDAAAGAGVDELAERLGKVEPPTSSVIPRGQTPVFWERTRGANIVDADGNVYVDLTAGFCVATAGHSNPRIVQAIAKQSETMMHSQGGVNPNRNRVELAEKLSRPGAGRAVGLAYRQHGRGGGGDCAEDGADLYGQAQDHRFSGRVSRQDDGRAVGLFAELLPGAVSEYAGGYDARAVRVSLPVPDALRR